MKYDEQADLRVISQNSRRAMVGREHERIQLDELLAEMESAISRISREETESMQRVEATPQEIDDGPITEVEVPVAETTPSSERLVSAIPASAEVGKVIEGDRGPVQSRAVSSGGNGSGNDQNIVGNGGNGGSFHKRSTTINFSDSFKNGVNAVRRNLIIAMGFTIFLNVLVLAIPIYLFQISDRVLTSRSTDTLVMLTIVIVGAVIVQVILDAIRRFILMRTAVEVAVQLGAPILSAAARASLHGNGKDYQVLGDLQQLRSFLTSSTLLSFFDAPIAPLFVLAVFLVHPHLGYIVVFSALLLLFIAVINQRCDRRVFCRCYNLSKPGHAAPRFDVEKLTDHQCAGDDSRSCAYLGSGYGRLAAIAGQGARSQHCLRHHIEMFALVDAGSNARLGRAPGYRRTNNGRYGDCRIDHCWPRLGTHRRRDRRVEQFHTVPRCLWPYSQSACRTRL